MGKELEVRVEELIRLEGVKKEAGRAQYQADKVYGKEYDAVFAMVKAGQTLPQGSSLYARLEMGESGRVNYKYVVDEFGAKYPQYANTIHKLIDESRHVEQEKLEYGKVSAAKT